MPFGLEPRKLVEETKKKEKEEQDNIVWETIAKDIETEETEKALRKKSTIKDVFSKAEQAIRESNGEAWDSCLGYEEKRIRPNL